MNRSLDGQVTTASAANTSNQIASGNQSFGAFSLRNALPSNSAEQPSEVNENSVPVLDVPAPGKANFMRWSVCAFVNRIVLFCHLKCLFL